MITQTLYSKDCPVDGTYSKCAFPQIQIQIAFVGKTIAISYRQCDERFYLWYNIYYYFDLGRP